jgi:hypothetical protein
MIETILQLITGSGVYAAFDPLTLTALAISLAGGVGSMIGSAGVNKTRQRNLDTQKAESNAFFNKEYYTDELSRTENQSVLRTLTDRLKDQNKQSQATNAITGATPEVAIAQKGNANKAYADVVNRIAGMASQRKDMIGRQWQADKRALYGIQDNVDASKVQSWANLGSNAAGLGTSAILAGMPGADATNGIVEQVVKV